MLLLVRRRIWPVVLTAGLAGFFLYDLQTGGPIRPIAWLILSNAVEVLIAALCLRISFEGVPQLNSVKSLAKYSFYAVFLAPFVGAFLGGLSTSSNYWASWKQFGSVTRIRAAHDGQEYINVRWDGGGVTIFSASAAEFTLLFRKD